MKKFFFLIAKVAIITVIIIVLLISGANWYFHFNQPGYYQSQYSITVHNLSYYSGSFITDILVPIPQLNNEYVFSDREMQNKRFGNWKSVLVVSQEGKMLALQSVGGNFSDISATFVTDHRQIGDKQWRLENLSLTPVVDDPDQLTQSQQIPFGSEPRHSTTLLYIPDEIKPLTNDRPPITVDLEYIVSGDRVGFNYLDDFKLRGIGFIPVDVRGKIPIKVQSYSRKTSSASGNTTWSVIQGG